MARQVTFECDCPQSVGQAFIYEADGSPDDAPMATITFLQSGTQKPRLEDGKYRVRIRAMGTPETSFSLTVTAGGTMSPFADEEMPDGFTAGRRTLVVPEAK